MSTKMTRQTTFTLGEVDQTTWKRTDVGEYLTGAQSLLNCEVGTTGLAKKRKGTSVQFNPTAYAQPFSKMYEIVDNYGIAYLCLSTGTGTWYIFQSPFQGDDVIDYLDNYIHDYLGNQIVVSQPMALFQNVRYANGDPLPYSDTDLAFIDYSQDNDSLVLTSPDHPPGRIFADSYNVDGVPHFVYETINIYPLPAYDFNTINYNNFSVTLSVTSNVLTFQFTGLSGDPGFTNAWIGGQIVGGGSTATDPIGYAIITAVSYSGGTTTFTATVQIPFNTSTYAAFGSQYSIRQPAFSNALGWPAKCLFFQNRLWLANTYSLGDTLFGSKINQPVSFDVGTGLDTDAIIYTLGQTAAGSIQWLNAGKQLEVFCTNAEFACPQDQNVGLTPATFSIRQQSSYGCSPIFKPITYINDSYYVTKTGKSFTNFHFNGIGLTYTSTNISAASSHLIKAPTNRALLRGSDTSQDNFIYLLNPSDDSLTNFQFATETKLAAFSPSTFNGDVELIDIVTIGNTIFMLKYYTLTQQFTFEILDDSTRIDAQFLAGMGSDGSVNGLNLVNGYTVQVVYQGQDYGQYLVENNSITVQNNGNAGAVQIGLLYDVEIIPMYPFIDAVSSPFYKQVTRIYVDYYQSLVFSINGTLVPYQYYATISQGLQPQTDTAIVDPFSGWNRFNNNGVPIISITQTSPFDLQILGIGYQIAGAVI